MDVTDMDILIKNVLIPCGDGTEKSNILISDGVISDIGSDVTATESCRVINGERRLAIPALINTHTHAYMTLMRGCADDLPFEKWLFEGVMPREDRMQSDAAYWSCMLACTEMIKSGTGTFCDMHMFPGASAEAALKTGMRAVITRGLSGSNGGERRLNEQFAEIEKYGQEERLSFMLAPHAIYTCDRPYLERISALAREKDLGIHIHVSEGINEVESCIKEHGISPVEYLDSLGLLSEKTLAAHCVHLSDRDIGIFAERGVSVSANAKSNLKLGNGIAPIARLDKAGVNICLGTDSTASNNSLNLFSEMNFTALIHKGLHRDPTVIPAKRVFEYATKGGAKALHLEKVGELAVGCRADIALLNTDCPSMIPLGDVSSALCYSANGSEVDTMIIDGQTVMENRTLTLVDEEEIIYNAKRFAKEV